MEKVVWVQLTNAFPKCQTILKPKPLCMLSFSLIQETSFLQQLQSHLSAMAELLPFPACGTS